MNNENLIPAKAKDGGWTCDKCSLVFRTRLLLDTHKKEVHKNTKEDDYKKRSASKHQICSCCGWKYEKLQLSERKWTCPKCGTNHIRDVNAAINLKNYVPLEEREFTPVESDKVKSLALLALQVGSLNEAGNHSQATSGRNVLGL